MMPSPAPAAVMPRLLAGDVLTGYGHGLAALWQGLMARRSAIAPSERFDASLFPVRLVAEVDGLQVQAGTSRASAMLATLLAPLLGRLPADTPLLLATTVGAIEHVESAASRMGHDPAGALALAQSARPAALLAQAQGMLGLSGQGRVISSACASSSAAVALASDMVRARPGSAVLVVAVDAVTDFVLAGFTALASLDDQPARPFDADRAGLSLGESAAWALIAADPCAADLAAQPGLPGHRFTTPLCLAGHASTADASHMTAPDAAGGGLALAVSRACAMAGLAPEDIDFVAAHGTATRYSDAMELAALRRLRQQACPVFSIKGGIGHTLGAAGLTQLLVAGVALHERCTPPTVGLRTPDVDALGWVHDRPMALAAPAGRPMLALSTNAGFGGVNTAIVLAMGDRAADSAQASPLPGAQRAVGQGHVIASRDAACRVLAVGWHAPSHHGWAERRSSFTQSHDLTPDAADSHALVGRPVKYFQRMTAEARHALCAASLALRAMDPDWLTCLSAGASRPVVGLLSGRFDGCLQADLDYYTDYLATGRTLARGNRFVYTLPTSVAGAVSVELGLTGPLWHLEEARPALASLVTQARDMVCQGQADGMLILWSDNHAAVCLAVDGHDAESPITAWPTQGDDAPAPLVWADGLAERHGRAGAPSASWPPVTPPAPPAQQGSAS